MALLPVSFRNFAAAADLAAANPSPHRLGVPRVHQLAPSSGFLAASSLSLQPLSRSGFLKVRCSTESTESTEPLNGSCNLGPWDPTPLTEEELPDHDVAGTDVPYAELSDAESNPRRFHVDRAAENTATDFSRLELKKAMRDGIMPPWPQPGVLENVAGINVETLVTADAVYNTELSWLSFNWRVLYMALDHETPLVERLRFLAISSRNLDEFFCKRVGALKRQEAAGVENLITGDKARSLLWTPTQTLKLVAREVEKMVQTQVSCLLTDILPEMRRQGFNIVHWEDLDPAQQHELRESFHRNLEPLLTPLAVDPGHPFPFMSNMTLAIAVTLRDPLDGDEEFAVVAVPQSCGRWVQVGPTGEDGDCNLISVEELIIANLEFLFGGMEILSAHCFRVTRNADVERNEETADDLLEMITDEMRERKFAPIVRLEVDCEIPEPVLLKLTSELALKNKDDVYCICGPLSLADMDTLPVSLAPDSPLQFLPWVPLTHPKLHPSLNIFEAIRNGDILVHHPYHSFGTSVLHFVESAMRDPKVQAIKATLYRTSADSPIIDALIKAAEYGKQVAVLVELKARFDEARNVGFAQILENAGCHVGYGLVGLKTHCKCIMVVREEDEGCRTYVHIGTGNYNPRTAAVYTDFGLFSCDPALGDDVRDLFKYLTGYHRQSAYKKLLVAPGTMRREFLRLIDEEISNAVAGKPARVVVKCNGLDDEIMVAKLYEAAQQGVRVDCIVRGPCRLRAGVPGVSENIRVVSILGRFLEHHRIFYFENGGEPKYYIGSSDWMSRNLSRRVEVVTPVENRGIKAELQAILDACLYDKKQAWDLQPDGRYLLLYKSEEYVSTHPGIPRPHPESKLASAERIGVHQSIMNLTSKRVKKARKVSLKKRDGRSRSKWQQESREAPSREGSTP